MIYKLQFADLLPYWDVLLRGLVFTIVLTIASTVAFIAMTINLGAYSIEIIRAGIQAVPKGHLEAGASLAMTRLEVLRYIVLKQAFQKIYPALSSQIVIVMLGS